MRRNRRGSVAVLALIMVVATATLALTLVTLSGAVRTKQVRLEGNRVVQNAFDGGVDTIRDMAARGVLRLPQTVTTAIGPVQETLALSDVTGQTVSLGGVSITPSAPTILVDGTLTYNGCVYRQQEVIGRGLLSTVWQYAIYVDSSISTFSTITTGSTGFGGDAWFDGNVNIVDGSTHFGGDLTATGWIFPWLPVDGKTTTNSPSIAFPNTSPGTYQAAATTQIFGGVIHGYVFPSATPSGYPLVYSQGDTTISGSFSGSGVVFVNGDVMIDDDITTGVGNHLVIIATGDVSLTASAVNINAYIYSGGTLSTGWAGKTRSFTGGIVAKRISVGDNISASFDTLVRDNPAEAYNLKLPGVWP